MDDESLRRAYRTAHAGCPRDGVGCPSPDELLAAAEGRLDEPRRTEVAAIVAGCAQCAAVVAMAGDVRAASADLAGELTPNVVPMPTPRRAPVRIWHYALAAALVLAFMPLMLLREQPGGPIMRGDESVVLPGDGATLAAAPATLAWPRDAGDTCRATLRDASGNRLLDGTAAAGGQALDETVRAQLVPGDYVWHVDCGSRRLGPFAFRIAP